MPDAQFVIGGDFSINVEDPLDADAICLSRCSRYEAADPGSDASVGGTRFLTGVILIIVYTVGLFDIIARTALSFLCG